MITFVLQFLTKLNLSYNQIEAEGAKHLAENLLEQMVMLRYRSHILPWYFAFHKDGDRTRSRSQSNRGPRCHRSCRYFERSHGTTSCVLMRRYDILNPLFRHWRYWNSRQPNHTPRSSIPVQDSTKWNGKCLSCLYSLIHIFIVSRSH